MDSSPPWLIAVCVVGSVCAAWLLSWLLTRAPYFSLSGAVVVITGGSSGIGKATAAEVLARGGHVALLARRADVLKGSSCFFLLSRPCGAQ